MATTKPKNIDEYISGFPKEVQKMLEQVRTTIKKAAPGVEESISYAIPAFNLKGRYVVYFAAYKTHIGLYPVPTGHTAFEKAFSSYKTSGKGTIQFPLNKPLPLSLITKIVKFRVKENEDKASKKNTFLALLAAPARRALENNGITTLKKLSKFSEKEVLGFHGMGKSSIPKLREALAGQGLTFKK